MRDVRPRPDTDLSMPAAWRWVLFVTLCLLIVSFWLPTAPPDEGETPSPFSATNVIFLAALALLAVAAVPATTRIRVILFALLVGSTVAAWLLADTLRSLMGPPWSG